MPTGIQVYQALDANTKNLEMNKEVRVNYFEALDLCKLTTKDLLILGFGGTTAERVSAALWNRDLGPLGHYMGLSLISDKNAPQLFPL